MSESHCAKHNWYQDRIPLGTGCPYCRIAALTATIAQQQADMRVLSEAVVDMDRMVEDWSAYASNYFQEKWNLAGDIKKCEEYVAIARKVMEVTP